MEVTSRRIRVVPRAVIVIGGISDIKDDLARGKVEDDTSLVVGSVPRRANSYGIQNGGSTCDGDRHAEGAIGPGCRADYRGLALVICIGGGHMNGVADDRCTGNGHRRAIDP